MCHLTKAELAAIDIELSRTVDLARFVDLSEVEVDAPNYVAPEGKIGDETFRVLRSNGCATRGVSYPPGESSDHIPAEL